MRLIGSILANAVALFATQIVPGIVFQGSLLRLLIAGVIFGLFNMIVRPIAMFLSLPLLILTLGLFYFVLNGLLLLVVSYLLPGYHVAGLIPAILGSLVITVVNWALHALFGSDKRRERDSD
jgi:putative membrane protein